MAKKSVLEPPFMFSLLPLASWKTDGKIKTYIFTTALRNSCLSNSRIIPKNTSIMETLFRKLPEWKPVTLQEKIFITDVSNNLKQE